MSAPDNPRLFAASAVTANPVFWVSISNSRTCAAMRGHVIIVRLRSNNDCGVSSALRIIFAVDEGLGDSGKLPREETEVSQNCDCVNAV
jgi:hypothetical protein